MKKIYRKMMVLMNRKQKLKMVQILFMMVIGAILETVSIGLVVPAIQMIMDPSCVEGDSVLAQIYRWTGFQKPGYFTALILVLIILGFVLKNVFLYFQNVVQLRFVYTNQFETSQRMMINFMKRPYEYYLNADTSVIQRMITSDVNNMYGLILALLQLVSEVIIFVLLAVTLTTIAVLLIVTLLVIKQFLKPIMRQAGIENQDYYSGLYKWIEESVMGIKEIKIANKENYFIREYGKCGHGYVSAVQKYNIFNAPSADRDGLHGRTDPVPDFHDPVRRGCHQHGEPAGRIRRGCHAASALCKPDQQLSDADFLFRALLYGRVRQSAGGNQRQKRGLRRSCLSEKQTGG